MSNTPSNTNCRPGQLAIVVRAVNACNIGRIVRVIEDWADRTTHNGYTYRFYNRANPGPIWLVESLSGPLTYQRKRYSVVTDVYTMDNGPCPDSYLRPLPDEEDVLAMDNELEVGKVS